MARAGINAVRTYTAPPPFVLDAAAANGLWVMAGLAWEQHVAVLDEPGRATSIEAAVREQAAACTDHPALLCFAIGNEIPTPLVRWHGRRRLERFLARLADAVRDEAPDTLLTYVNYPSTEYLRLPFLDFIAFNLYLEEPTAVAAYLARLQNLAGEKPLVLAELGADSLRNGLDGQARAIGDQLSIAADAACAGTFVFSWTDEWHRGDSAIVDWDFGLVDRNRRPKPALATARAAYTSNASVDVPLVSVVVCSHNGARHIGECLAGIAALRYPRFETIVVDDGSTDGTAAIASEFEARVITTPNDGLSAARNVGLHAARGEIVAYLDDDAYPDRDWLHYLAIAFRSTSHVAVGGPNLPPGLDGDIASCVANAPGGPVHVLISDSEAEHLPGCNMAFRRTDLLAIGGFDDQFTVAGDDVDICWRLTDADKTLGFHAGAVVWHHRRSSVLAYLRQQRGYGRAEALLERKWPEKYTRRGHLTWRGRLYDRASATAFRRSRIYHGTWGSGAFQPAEERPNRVRDAVLAPDWVLVLAFLAGISALGIVLRPLFYVGAAALVAAVASSIAAAVSAAVHADVGRKEKQWRLRMLIAALHLLQPPARLAGRLLHGLSPWRRHAAAGVAFPHERLLTAWHEAWVPAIERVEAVEDAARRVGARIVRGGPYASFDLEISAGAFGSARLLVAVEEHGRGRQLVRCRVWPRVSSAAWRMTLTILTVGDAAVLSARNVIGWSAVAIATTIACAAMWEAARATATAVAAFSGETEQAAEPAWLALRMEEA